jgi:O-antigen ligase
MLREIVNNFKKTKIKFWETFFLCLLIISLPSLEAPKNIFLFFYIIIAIKGLLKRSELIPLNSWDAIFASLLASTLISASFAGFQNNNTWNGFIVLLTMVSVGWLVSRANFTNKEIKWLFFLIIISTLPPLFYGLWQFLIMHSKDQLEINSVGHVNHSAIYLSIISGACLGWILAIKKFGNNKLLGIFLALLIILFWFSLIIGKSRAAVGAFLLLAFLSIIIFVGNPKKKIIALSIFTIFIISPIFLNVSIVQKQLVYQEDKNAMADRLQIWNAAIEIHRMYPIFGIGTANWGNVSIEDLRKNVESRNERFDEKNYITNYGHAHSTYFSILVEKGILSFIFFINFMLYWIWSLALNVKYAKINNDYRMFWIGSFSAWIGIFVIGLVNSSFNHEKGILACLLLGIYISATKKINKQKNNKLK